MSEELTRNLPGDGLEQILSLLRGMDAQLTSLENCIDRWLIEDHSIWEQVLTRLEAVPTKKAPPKAGMS